MNNTVLEKNGSIFIVGRRRSGTNLLENILGNHKNIQTIKDDAEIFTKGKSPKRLSLIKRYEKDKDFEKLTLSMLSLAIGKLWFSLIIENSQNERFPQEAVQMFNEIKKLNDFKNIKNKFDAFKICANYITQKNGKKRWTNRMPHNIHNIPFILSLYPNAQFIEIYRDPRAVYYSLETRSNYTELFSVNEWCRAIKQGEKLSQKLGPEQYYRICYEDLITSPKDEVTKLCNFLNEDFDPNMLNTSVVITSFKDTYKDSGISTIPLERWKQSLTSNELLFIDLITKKYRKKLNYPDSNAKLSIYNLISFICFLTKKYMQAFIEDRLLFAFKIKSKLKIKIALYPKFTLLAKYLFFKARKNLTGKNNEIAPTEHIQPVRTKEKVVYLTIDKTPLPHIKQKVDYLLSNKIPAIFFCSGDLIEIMFDDVVYAIKNGFVIGNYSYRNAGHSITSSIEIFDRILKTDKIIDSAYLKANIKRPIKLFRCPYGDKGRKSKRETIQGYLRELGYEQPKFEGINYDFYYLCNLDKDIDIHWTYEIQENKSQDINKILKEMEKPHPILKNNLINPSSNEIIAFHDYEDSNYIFFRQIDWMLERGIKFKLPIFSRNTATNIKIR